MRYTQALTEVSDADFTALIRYRLERADRCLAAAYRPMSPALYAQEIEAIHDWAEAEWTRRRRATPK